VAENTEYAVVVVSHNHADMLPACMAAVGRLEPVPRTVVVVDNASSDRSCAAADAFADRLPLQLLQEPTNTGFPAAANRGIEATDSPWVLSLNPDCAPRPDFVGRLLAATAERPESDRIGSVTGRLVRASEPDLTPEPVLDAAGMVVTRSGRHFDRGAGLPDDGRYDRPSWVFGGTAAATLYRRRSLDDVAYPDGDRFVSSFFAYREDAELAWRLLWRGWRSLYVPDAVAFHRRRFRPEQGRRGHSSINRHSVRNRFLLRWHCADLGWHLACFPWWLVRDIAVIGACLTVEWSSAPALAEVWRLRRDAQTRRRWVMARRSASSRQLRRWFRRRGWTEEIEQR
jgi:GT2 family glycosyltransferase